VAGWASGPLGRAQAADREIARQTALKARALAEFAATRPASVDRPQSQRGAMSAERWAARPELLRDVSEWAAQEVVIALSITAQAADTQLERSLTLLHRLPATLDALEAGLCTPVTSGRWSSTWPRSSTPPCAPRSRRTSSRGWLGG
jgi:hypothetical protein